MLYALIFYFAALTVTLFLAARYYAHMFQLEAYLPKQFFNWLTGNLSQTLVHRAFPAFAAAALLAVSRSVSVVLFGAVLILGSAYLYRPVKAKKPLVFTMRVKRLIVTFALLCILLSSLLFIFNVPLLSALLVLLSPFMILAANALNRPVERAVRRHYINEAKAIIRSRGDSLTVIGITGSYGKTSTKYFLERLLSQKYNVLMTPASFNTTMGVVKVVREMLKPSHEIFICEMGARNVGEIREICDIVLPDCGIITSIGPQHLETFKSIERIIQTKFELADAVGKNGFMLLNGDNRYIYERRYDSCYTYYGMENDEAAYFARDIKTTVDGTLFTLCMSDATLLLQTHLIGKHNVLNIVAAAGMAKHLGVSDRDIVRAVRMLEPVPHRLQMIDGGDLVIIDDAFNSNPSGAKSALEVLAGFDGVKILITPGMVELGESQSVLNREFGAQAADVCNYIYIVGKVNYESIYQGAASTGFDVSVRVIAVDSPEQALAAARALPTDRRKYVLLENDLPDNFR